MANSLILFRVLCSRQRQPKPNYPFTPSRQRHLRSNCLLTHPFLADLYKLSLQTINCASLIRHPVLLVVLCVPCLFHFCRRLRHTPRSSRGPGQLAPNVGPWDSCRNVCSEALARHSFESSHGYSPDVDSALRITADHPSVIQILEREKTNIHHHWTRLPNCPPDKWYQFNSSSYGDAREEPIPNTTINPRNCQVSHLC
ncbi:uncharacterized protein [Manis javanica]|uniref:uncharacterized protein isoform X2 n=1 Tax=Manis javanica TaxID=9974 RepID=UPI003C6D74D0